MLHSLRIKNLALIQNAELNLGSGLTTITGESGSGKSILLDALALVTGSTRSRVRASNGCSSGFVEAEFRPDFDEQGGLVSLELKRTLEEHGLLEACCSPEEPLILARRVDASGRTRCFVQGQTVTRAVLSQIGSCLVELCGQSEAHTLRTPAAQLAALDRFAQLGPKQRSLTRLVLLLRQQESEIERLEAACAEAERRRDFVEFQLSELDDLDLEGLEARRVRLDELTAATASLTSYEELIDTLDTSDQAVIPRLRWLSARLGGRLRGDPQGTISSAISTLDSAILELEELTRISSSALDDSDRDRAEAERLREEFSALWSLAQKHRVAVDELPQRRQQLHDELNQCSLRKDQLAAAQSDADTTRKMAQAAAEQLHEARCKAARLLDKRMKKELAQVGFRGASFETRLAVSELTASGVTQLDFAFSANPGHPAESLSRVASGGEMSRVLLCFRLATESAGALLVFDEIDAGAGGKTAEKIAAALKRAGAHGQVLCVTHWPQVAGVAEHQISVSKHILDGTTYTSVDTISGEERLVEISRMLGGAEETAREHACGLVQGTSKAA